MELFRPDSEAMEFLGKVADYIILNILCLLLCIPIVTAGPAICAKYYVSMKIARGEDVYVMKGFFKSFRENFKQASVIGIVLAIIIGILALDWYNVIWGSSQNMTGYMKAILAIVTYIVWSVSYCIFPILAYYNISSFELVKGAAILSFLNLPKFVLFCVAIVIEWLVIVWYIQWGLAIWILFSTVLLYLMSKEMNKQVTLMKGKEN